MPSSDIILSLVREAHEAATHLLPEDMREEFCLVGGAALLLWGRDRLANWHCICSASIRWNTSSMLHATISHIRTSSLIMMSIVFANNMLIALT